METDTKGPGYRQGVSKVFSLFLNESFSRLLSERPFECLIKLTWFRTPNSFEALKIQPASAEQ